MLDEEIDYPAEKIMVVELLERYIRLKQGVLYNTKVGYNFVLNLVKQEDFGYMYVCDIKMSDEQLCSCGSSSFMRTAEDTVPSPVCVAC